MFFFFFLLRQGIHLPMVDQFIRIHQSQYNLPCRCAVFGWAYQKGKEKTDTVRRYNLAYYSLD